jgi:cytochrome c oxidase subunit 4
MSKMTAEQVHEHVKIYIYVFIALAIFTVLTVAVSYLKLPVEQGISIALVIATVKASLVAAFFMHLRWEKIIIFSILILTFGFFLFLILLPAAASA